jgi:hypothetical protein
VTARHVHGTGDVALLVLVLLAHVDHQRGVAVRARDGVVDLAGVHLPDLLLDPLEQFRAACHPNSRKPGRVLLQKV